MSLEVHIDWQGESHLVGRLDAAERSASVSFEYAAEWLQRPDAFAIDPTSLPLQRGFQHGKSLFGAIQDCGPDRWGRVLIERAVRKKRRAAVSRVAGMPPAAARPSSAPVEGWPRGSLGMP